MRRRSAAGRALTAAELVAAVEAAGLSDAVTTPDVDRLRDLLRELGNYSILHLIRAEMVVRTGHRPRTPGWCWDDGREGGNR